MNSSIKEIYNRIKDDQNVINIYKEIETFEENNKGWAFHNYSHINNVSLLVSKILKELNFDEDYIYKALIACVLHDTGAVTGKENHAYRSYVYAKDYFFTNDIKFEGMDLVLEAIRIHSDGFDTNNEIALALILADKLDIKKDRISSFGLTIPGNRQYAHIEDIDILIKDGILTISFLSDNRIDLKELNEYYFTKKVFNAIKSFANKLGLKYKVLLDGEKWNI